MLCLSRPMGFGGRKRAKCVFCPLQSNPVPSPLSSRPTVKTPAAARCSLLRSSQFFRCENSSYSHPRLGIVSIEETSSRYVHETRRERPDRICLHFHFSQFPCHSLHPSYLLHIQSMLPSTLLLHTHLTLEHHRIGCACFALWIASHFEICILSEIPRQSFSRFLYQNIQSLQHCHLMSLHFVC